MEKYDLDNDGHVTSEEIEKIHKVESFKNNDQRADSQRKMTWISLGGMMSYPILMVLCTYLGMESAGDNLTEIAPTYFISTAGVIAAFFGVEAWKVK